MNDMTTIGFLILHDLHVEGMNMAATPFMKGYSMNSFAGFIHALQRDCNRDTPLFVFDAFMPVIHHNHASSSEYVARLVKQAHKEKNLDSPHGLTTKRCDGIVDFSLVIEVKGVQAPSDDPFNMSPTTSVSPDIDTLIRSISNKRFNGGFLELNGAVEYIDINQSKKLEISLSNIKPGSVFKDRTDLLIEYSTLKGSPFEAVMHAMALHPIKEEPESTDEGDQKAPKIIQRKRAQPGWIIPLATGFLSTEPPRSERIPDYAHVYAEPVVTLAECLSYRRLFARAVAQKKPLKESLPFWKANFDVNKGIYLYQH